MDDVPREGRIEYVNEIVDLLYQCKDIEILDFILQLLQKVVAG